MAITRDPGPLGIDFGFLNWLSQPGVVFFPYAGQIDAKFPAENLATPERPFVPTRTIDLTPVRWAIDLGTVRSIDVVAVINTNSQHCRLEYSLIPNDPTPSQIKFDNCARNPYNGRVNVSRWLVPPITARYLGFVAGEFPMVDPPWDRISIGGLFVGLGYPAPRDIGWNYKPVMVQPRIDNVSSTGQWRQRLNAGDAFTRLTAHRLVFPGPLGPAHDDQLAAWLELERTWEIYDVALVTLRKDNPALTWMMRRTSQPEWQVAQDFPESDIELEEAIA